MLRVYICFIYDLLFTKITFGSGTQSVNRTLKASLLPFKRVVGDDRKAVIEDIREGRKEHEKLLKFYHLKV